MLNKVLRQVTSKPWLRFFLGIGFVDNPCDFFSDLSGREGDNLATVVFLSGVDLGRIVGFTMDDLA